MQRFIAVLLFLGFHPLVAWAEIHATDARFSLRMLGVKVGELEMTGREGEGSYEAEARFATVGLAGAVARVRFDMQAEGRQSGTVLTPRLYSGDINTGRDRRATTLRFQTNDGRVDPMTALYAGLRDRPADQGCALSGVVFDGKKTQNIRLRETARSGSDVTCTGRMDRIGGYTADELTETTGFPITVVYHLSGNVLRAQSATVHSLHGKVELVRK